MAQVTLGPGYQIVFEAIDPTDGSAVSGVVVSNIAIGAADMSGDGGAATLSGPYLYQVGASA